MENKICGHCKKDLPINNYYKNKQQKNGYSSWCKICEREKKIKYRESNKELFKQKRHEQYLKNKEHEDARNKKYNQKHKEKLQKYAKEFYKENSEYYKNLNHDWYIKNKEKYDANKKIYYKNNKEKILARQKEYKIKFKSEIAKRLRNRHHERKREDVIYALKIIVRQVIRDSLRRKKYKKCDKTFVILGCDINFFKNYIESKFDKNMSWENYGSYWWFDHIVPLDSAITQEDVIKLNHYTNFQPLFWRDNIIKSNKII